MYAWEILFLCSICSLHTSDLRSVLFPHHISWNCTFLEALSVLVVIEQDPVYCAQQQSSGTELMGEKDHLQSTSLKKKNNPGL